MDVGVHYFQRKPYDNRATDATVIDNRATDGYCNLELTSSALKTIYDATSPQR